MNENILFFDGICNLCNTFVNLVIDVDENEKIKFASLQSDFGQKFLRDNHFSETEFNTFILFSAGKIYKKSAAVYRIFRLFGGFWKILLIFDLLPRTVSDFFYDFIARNRYKFFGKKESCRMPTPELKKRFL
jgi:predicted DCC family thiol-disulfide oxidoreductase YuxK